MRQLRPPRLLLWRLLLQVRRLLLLAAGRKRRGPAVGSVGGQRPQRAIACRQACALLCQLLARPPTLNAPEKEAGEVCVQAFVPADELVAERKPLRPFF